MKKHLTIAISGLTIVLIAVFFISASARNKPLEIKTDFVNTLDIYNSVLSSGEIEDIGQTRVFGQGTGVVTKVFVRAGQSVVKGQALFEMEDSAAPESSIVSPELEAAAKYLDISQDTITALLQGASISAADSESGYSGYVVSPCDGIVMELKVQKGSLVTTSTNCATVSDMSSMTVRVSISEGNVADLKIGMPVDITGPGFPGRTYKGVLTQIMPSAIKLSSLTGTGETVVEAIVTMKDPDVWLKPGYTANVKIFTTRKIGTIVVPYEAIKQDEFNIQMVFINENGIARKQIITTGYELEDCVEVLTGLSPGQEVILNPGNEISDGIRVTAN